MTFRTYLLRFIITATATAVLIFGVNYFMIKRRVASNPAISQTNEYKTEKPSEKDMPISEEQSAPGQTDETGLLLEDTAIPANESSASEQMPADNREPAESSKNAIAPERKISSSEEYSLPHSQSGALKDIADNGSSITITSNGSDYRAIVTDSTVIIRDTVKASLSEIKETDNITIVGRKKSADSQEFIADSVYAVNSAKDIVPLTPDESIIGQ